MTGREPHGTALAARYPDFYRDLIDLSLDLVTVIDEHGTILYECPAIEAVLGFTLGERIGGHVLDYVHPDDRPRASAALDRVIGGLKETDAAELRLQRKDGTWCDLEAIGRRWLLEGRVHVLLNIRDVTERRTAARELAQSNELLTKTLRASRSVVSVTDLETGEYLEVNDEWLRVTGLQREAAIGHSAYELGIWGSDEHRDRLIAEIRASGGRLRDYEASLFTPRGRRQLVINVEQLTIAERPMLLLVGSDVTDSRLTETKLRQAQKMEAVGQLTGGLAHDFNNLLGIIIGHAELLQSALGGRDELARLVAPIVQASERGATLTRQLLAFSRRQVLDPTSVDMAQAVEQLLPLLRTTLGPNVAIHSHAGAGLWPALVDPAQLESALLNLALNARDAMPSGGRLDIDLTNRTITEHAVGAADPAPGDYVALSLGDTGHGMDAGVKERAFEPFFTTKESGQGTGLGLSMVFGFARQSGGQVYLESERGQGTRVTLLLPRAPAAAAAPGGEGGDMPRGQGESILILDDEASLLSLVEEMLSGLGYRVITAQHEDEAMAQLAGGEDVELVLSDVLLAGPRQGPEVVAEMLASRPELRVVYMSGFPAGEADGGMPGSRVPLLRKPFTLRMLAERIREALQR